MKTISHILYTSADATVHVSRSRFGAFSANFTKKALFIGVFSLFALSASLAATSPQIAYAATPTIGVASAGTNTVQLSVNGDPNQSVNLYYYPLNSTGSVNSVGSIGYTNSSGYFSNTVSSTAYNIPAGSNAYVTVNGQQSSTIQWPSTSGGNVYLSQSSITMNQGQNASVSISGGLGTNTSNSYYVASNSNSTVASASVSGSILTITASASNSGYTVINVCSLSSNAGCSSIAVTVNNNNGNNGNNGNGNGNGSYGPITLSQSSVTVAPGQTQSVTIYSNIYNGNSGGYYTGYNNGYYIANNPGTSIFSASISGNTLTIYGTNAGSATVNICSQNSTSSCASLYVTVSGSYYNGYNNGYNNGNSGFTTYNYNSEYNNGYGYNGNGSNYGNGFTATNPYTYTTYANQTSYPSAYTSYPTNSYVSASNVGRSVSGVYLSQVPSTGISFSFKMTLFVLGLVLWSIFGAYMIARKKSAHAAAFEASGVSAAPKTIGDKVSAFKAANMKKKGIL